MDQGRAEHIGEANLEANREQKTEYRSTLLSYVKAILVTVLVAFTLKMFVVEAFRIPSASMESTLMVGDFLLVNKFLYGIRTPRYVPLTKVAIPTISFPSFQDVERGAVIVFEFPGERNELHSADDVNYIKRCIGLPGDTVELHGSRVFINGHELSLPPFGTAASSGNRHWKRNSYLFPPGAGFTDEQYGPLWVPKRGGVIELNETNLNRWRAFIAREGHRVRVDDQGTVYIDDRKQSTYTVEQNYYFVLGDNRDNSLDSRYWGFVPADHIIGEALMIYWSWDPDIPANSLWEKLKSVRWNRIGALIR